jgi:hypothetical protein
VTGVAELAGHVRRAIDPVALAERIGTHPDPWQERALRSSARELLFLVHRQGGKNHTAALLATHAALYRPGSTTLVVAPGERQSKELVRTASVIYRQLGRPIPTDADSKLTLELETGSRIIALPGSEATIRTYSADLVIFDEASRIPDEVYYAVRPMVTITRGRKVAMTTPFGKRGWFHDAWTDHAQRWERYIATGLDCPRLTADDLEAEWRAMGDWMFRQEYLLRRLGPGRFEPEPDPFVDTVNQIFPTHLLEAAISDDVEPLFPVAAEDAARHVGPLARVRALVGLGDAR